MRADIFVNYLSITIVLAVGVMILFGVIGLPETPFRIGIGLIVIIYALVRFGMIYVSSRRPGKTP